MCEVSADLTSETLSGASFAHGNSGLARTLLGPASLRTRLGLNGFRSVGAPGDSSASMARTAFYLLVGGSSAALLSLLFEASETANVTGVAATAIAGLVLSVAVLTAYDRVRIRVFQVLANIAAVLADCGASWADVVKTTIFLAGSMEHFATVNERYAEAIGEHRPARSTVAVAALPLGALVEIEIVIHRP
jgi:hypothetical protein